MAEGLIELKEGAELEEIGNQYYNDLKGRSLIQQDDRMDDMVHHLACIVSGKFVSQRNSGYSSSTSSLQNVRHASIKHKSELLFDAKKLCTLIHEVDLCQEILSYKRLRVLKLDSFSDLPNSIGCDLKHLRYLQLSDGVGNCCLPDSICTLTNLQVLDLWYCPNLQNFPQDLRKLQNLRFLRLRNADISSLPDSLCDLSNLRVLDLSYCECLTNLPMDISNPLRSFTLSNLQVLDLSFCAKLSILPESVCKLVNLRVLDLSGCQSLTALPKDIGNLHRLHELKIDTGVRLPEFVVKAMNLRVLDVSTNQPAHIGKLTKLEKLIGYHVGKENGHRINELKDMNRLKGSLIIGSMENIESAEEASMADLKSKKHIERLEFIWNNSDVASTGRDGEMEVSVVEALEPNAALHSLSFRYYTGSKFPRWMSSKTFDNLTELVVWDLLMVTRMEGMVFQYLKVLWVKNCPALEEISMKTPKLEELIVVECKELKVFLLPGLWDTLKTLECEYFHLDYFMQQLKAANASPTTKLNKLILSVGEDNGITSLPVGWPSILTSLEYLALKDLPPKNFKILSEAGQTCLVKKLIISHCLGLVSLNSLELPAGLKILYIVYCQNLRSLPSGLRNLTSLRKICLQDCPNLQISYHDRLPPSVTHIEIRNCPKLEEQLKREGRPDWKFF